MGKTPKNFIDLTNESFGALIVIKRIDDRVLENGEKRTCWLCKCDCGNYKEAISRDLKRGSVTSCGCRINQSKKRIKYTLDGKRFGRLKVIKSVSSFESGEEDKTVMCQCDCGKIIYANRDSIISGNKKSCGCLKEEMMGDGLHRKYEYDDKRLYDIWYAMISRCTNRNNSGFYLYGGRGITVCKEWIGENGFENFYIWAMENGYRDGLSIDRKNVNGGYCPENCRWSTIKEQNNNTRRNVFLEYDGKRQTMAQWSEETGIKYGTIRGRLKRGWSVERTLTTPV